MYEIKTKTMFAVLATFVWLEFTTQGERTQENLQCYQIAYLSAKFAL